MRYVLAPRANSALFAQDYFVNELSEIPGYQLLKNLHDNSYITQPASPDRIAQSRSAGRCTLHPPLER